MLSVLIVNWNTREHLLACLRSLQDHPPKIDHEVIVVDNASTDASADAVKSQFPKMTLLEPGRNLGYAAGNNLAFQRAKGDYLLALNPDTEVFDQTLDLAVQRLQAYPHAGCLAARLLSPDGSTQRSVRGFPTPLGLFGDLTGLGKLFPNSSLGAYRMRAFDYDKEQPAPQPMGTFLLFGSEALEEIQARENPFDPAFPIFFNDVDLLFRLLQKQWTCVYSPQVRVLHHGGLSTRQVRKSMIWESHRSLIRYLSKHATGPLSRLGVSLLAPAVYAGAFIRAKGYDPGFRA